MEHEVAVCEQLSLKPSTFGLDGGSKVRSLQFDSDNQAFCVSYKDASGYNDSCQLYINKVIDALTDMKQHVAQ